jgi:antitoxin ParD1/3/4
MAMMTVSLPDLVKDWIEKQVREGDYASASDYLSDLVRRDRARQGEEFTLEELRHHLADARESGASRRRVGEIFREAEAVAAGRGGSRD